jgi:hypothetical protein
LNAELLVAMLALVISVVALVWTVYSQRIQAKHAILQENMAILVEIWGALGRKSSMLRFHGISEAELSDAGVDAEELAYLIASFEAASVYYRYFENTPEPFPEGSLRQRMCASEATQKAWPVLKRFFAGDRTYLAKIEATMRQHRPLPAIVGTTDSRSQPAA